LIGAIRARGGVHLRQYIHRRSKQATAIDTISPMCSNDAPEGSKLNLWHGLSASA
jgi:hypothetical protein